MDEGGIKFEYINYFIMYGIGFIDCFLFYL